MKKSVSIVYTITVIIIVLLSIGIFTWQIYQSRSMRISNFEVLSDEYIRRLDESMGQDVDKELELAENLINEDSSITAIQVSSKENGLRLSIVKPAIKNFSQVSISESNHFDKLLTRIRYYRITKPLTLNDGFEATFVSTVITNSEIRNKLTAVLIILVGLFLITFVLILVNSGTWSAAGQDAIESENLEHRENSDLDVPNNAEIASAIESPEEPYYSQEDDSSGTYDEIDESFDDFAPVDRLDENDLLVAKPEYGESISMEKNDLPNFDLSKTKSNEKNEIMNRLDMELENAAASNRDLSLIIVAKASNIDELVREHYPNPKPVFPIDNKKAAVIEANEDLDSSISKAKDFLHGCLSKNSDLEIVCGIAARNGRIIGANELYQEATSSLLKADKESRIVGFRSDPEKYRDFIRDQKND